MFLPTEYQSLLDDREGFFICETYFFSNFYMLNEHYFFIKIL